MSSYVLKGAIFPDGTVADLLVADGVIAEIGSNLRGDEIVD
jgi:dihydroorotase-like cyclic amidohydrolase